MRPLVKCGLAALCWLLALQVVHADSAYDTAAPLPPAQEARYRALLKDLRCLVCQNESLADSDAPLAADLRKQVRGMVAADQSDAQVRKYLTDRYGDFVLYKPPFQPNTWLLWGGPFALAFGGLLMLLAFLRRARKRQQPASLDEAALKRVLNDLDQRP